MSSVRIILVHPLDNKNPADLNGVTPLHIAAEIEICKYIVSQTGDKFPKTNDGLTPLDFRKQNGRTPRAEIVEFFSN